MKIEAGSVITLPQKVTTDCDLRWKFKTKEGDLCFGVQRKKTDKDPFVTVLAPSRVSFLVHLLDNILTLPGTE